MEKNKTAVEWLIEQVESPNWLNLYAWHKKEVFDHAIQMEKEQLENARPQIVSNCIIKEISDEEIEEQSKYWNETTNPDMWTFKLAWEAGAKWYREQLKNK